MKRFDRIGFFLRFLKDPKATGALLPSSRVLVRRLLSYCDLRSADCVVELGPGTGVFTKEILKELKEGAVFVAIELDKKSAEKLQKRFPNLRVFARSAEELPEILEAFNVKADVIVSTLPWANMKKIQQEKILEALCSCMNERAELLSFSYVMAFALPAYRSLRVLLKERFDHVQISPVVWRNMPPARVLYCRSVKGWRN